MGKKYIIELEDKPFHKGNGDFLYRVKGFNSLVFDMTGINKLTPYTEPDLERVRLEAYEKGYKTAKCQCNIQAEKDLREVGKRHYQKGLSEAWEAARKIGDMTLEEQGKIFNTITLRDIVSKFTVAEVIERLKQYEQKQEEQIQVGDEVVSEDDIKAVVIDMDDYLLHVLDENGVVQGWPRENVAKNDRHFPEIAAVIKKMKEAQK